MRKLTKKERYKLVFNLTDDEMMNHVVWCLECNHTYSSIQTHAKKWRARRFIEDNKIDKRSNMYKWSKEGLKV